MKKIRVHELAKELNISTSELLNLTKTLNILEKNSSFE